MNKKNTVLVLIVLVMLVLLLITKGCVHRRLMFNKCSIDKTEQQVVCKKDLKPSASIDSTAVKNCNYPIVIHYKEPRRFGNVTSKNHILGLTWTALDSCPPMPDSTGAIHVYIRNGSNMCRNIYWGVYYKTSMNEEFEYKLTYPVNDGQGLRIVTDSGTISSVMHWKSYGLNSPVKFRKQADERMTKIVEENLLSDIVKKMQRNNDSE